MVDYSAKSVNKELKPMLRAIGRSFPKSKEEMVAYLEEYDRTHPEKPAHLCDVPPTRRRKTKASNTPAPAPNVAAQPSSDAPRSSRKRKESPAVQPEPQAKRVKADKKAALSRSTENDQNEDTAMPDVNNDETAGLRTTEPSRNARLSPVEEENEERSSQEGARHDAELMASKNAPKAKYQTKELEIGLENVQTTQAMVGGASSTSNAKRTREQYSGGLDQQLAKLDTMVKAGSRRTQTRAQSASGETLPFKDATNRGAAPKKGKTGKKQAMGDQDDSSTMQKQLDAVPNRVYPNIEDNSVRARKNKSKGKGKAVPSQHEASVEPGDNTQARDKDGNILIDIAEPGDDDTPATDEDPPEPPKLTLEQQHQLARADRIKKGMRPGGYADPIVADYWPVREQTVVLSLDRYFPPDHPKYLPIEYLHGDQWVDRFVAQEEAKGRVFEKMTCKSPEPPGEEDMVDYDELYDSQLYGTGVPSGFRIKPSEK